MKNFKKLFLSVVFILVITGILAAQEESGIRLKAAINGGLGLSFARGEYAEEFDSIPDFSWNPGIRVTVHNLISENIFIMADLGFLEYAWIGYVEPTDYYFYRKYHYLNINAMVGTSFSILYAAAGLYFGIFLDGNQYYEYTDEWTYFDLNSDFGILAEAGVNLFEFLSLGVQTKLGLVNVHNSTQVFTSAVYGIITVNILNLGIPM